MINNVNKRGGLIWITGYSGAGKTTVAEIVSRELKKEGFPILFLDGDDLRSIMGEKFGHNIDDRKQLAYIYSRLCKRVCDNGINVVIATIAMFESVRIENRESNPCYLEVYLDVPFEVRAERDPKGIYLAAKKRSKPFAEFLDRVVLKIPVIGEIMHNSAIARSNRTSDTFRNELLRLMSSGKYCFASSCIRFFATSAEIVFAFEAERTPSPSIVIPPAA